MIVDLQAQVSFLHNRASDINLHIPKIVELAQEVDHITEMGVREAVSAWAWLAGMPKDGLYLYDLHNPQNWLGTSVDPIRDLKDTAEAYNIPFEFHATDVLSIEIPETDLLIIDTWHCYDQLKLELKLHSNKAKKYICFHDTTSYAHVSEKLSSDNAWNTEKYGKLTPNKGVWDAVYEFLVENRSTWELVERIKYNNGFTIIKRI